MSLSRSFSTLSQVPVSGLFSDLHLVVSSGAAEQSWRRRRPKGGLICPGIDRLSRVVAEGAGRIQLLHWSGNLVVDVVVVFLRSTPAPLTTGRVVGKDLVVDGQQGVHSNVQHIALALAHFLCPLTAEHDKILLLLLDLRQFLCKPILQKRLLFSAEILDETTLVTLGSVPRAREVQLFAVEAGSGIVTPV